MGSNKGGSSAVTEFQPFLVALNLTIRCNLACEHCYLDAGEREQGDADELDTASVKRILTEISEVNPACMVVLTGGEPLLRADIYELCRHAASIKLMVVVGTNGTLLTKRNVRKLIKAGVSGVGISVDSLSHVFHNNFRGVEGALADTLEGIENCKREGLSFQIHMSVYHGNLDEIETMLAWAHSKGALVMNFFFLVCTGRGEKVTDITPQEYETVLSTLLDVQNKYQGMMVRARCAPHFKRLAWQKDSKSALTKAEGYEGGGCIAGTHYCRITPKGEVTVCPYIEESVGDLSTKTFEDIWSSSTLFNKLRRPKLSGKCGECEFQILCGGCRARPFAANGDLFGEDELCSYIPKGGAVIEPLSIEESEPLLWDDVAKSNLERLPFFLRDMIRAKVEQEACKLNINLVTPEFMEGLRKERFGNKMPIFNPHNKNR